MKVEIILSPDQLLRIRNIIRNTAEESEILASSNCISQIDRNFYQKEFECCKYFVKLLDLALDEGIYTFERANGSKLGFYRYLWTVIEVTNGFNTNDMFFAIIFVGSSLFKALGQHLSCDGIFKLISSRKSKYGSFERSRSVNGSVR